jgi:hypothetical protein
MQENIFLKKKYKFITVRASVIIKKIEKIISISFLHKNTYSFSICIAS